MKAATDDVPYVVEYHAYDPRLPEVFEKIKHLIQTASGAVRVEHIGSSSIPGVGGRNAVDIAVPVAEPQQPAIKRELYELGFEDAPFPHYLPLLVGQIVHETKCYPILLYVVSPESPVLADWLAFRDYMCAHPDDARAYCSAKQEAVAKSKAGGQNYQDAKNPFLASIQAKLRRTA
jgi:GrpB-like predicted nucleotidyltransferase (UPF0157 family)